MQLYATLLAALLLSAVSAPGALFYSGTNPLSPGNADINLAIPDGNPTGISSSITTSGLDLAFSSVTVTINLTGGFNGDLVAYLSYGNSSAVLLNRIGQTEADRFGSATAGFTSFTFADAGNSGLHAITGAAGNPLGGTYQPDGPSFQTALSGVGNPNGEWTLYFADLASGGNNGSTLVNWNVGVFAVPEPINVALGIFAVGFIGLRAVRIYRGSRKATGHSA